MDKVLTQEVEYTEVGTQKKNIPCAFKEGWVNVYIAGNGDTEVYNYIYPTEEKAKFFAGACIGYIDTVKINWKE